MDLNVWSGLNRLVIMSIPVFFEFCDEAMCSMKAMNYLIS
jgi:hypothetical protein